MKEKYVTPYIERNQVFVGGKFGHSASAGYQDKIENIAVSDLVGEYGSPLYIFSESKIRYKYKELSEAIRMYYPNNHISWSYKTNYLSAICSILHQEGAKAEIVSGMEYDIAKKLVIKGEDIIFNGPGKKRDELIAAVEDNVSIHIDHLDELLLLEQVADSTGIRPQVALRINMDTGIYPQWQRFGFNYENGEAIRTAQRLVKSGKLDLIGLHAHIGTFILESNAYYQESAKLLQLAQEIKQRFGIAVRYIDIGGGFASSNTLHYQYTPGDFASPTFLQYAEAIGKAFNESDFANEENPQLVLETGRAVIDEAGYMIATIIGKKYLPTGQRVMVLDAGVNSLITAWWYNLKIKPAQQYSGANQSTIFYGPLCMNIDLIKNAVQFPDLPVGSRVVITPVGAYNVTQWMQFIEYRPNVVLITETNNVELIREREDITDIIARQRVPEHLTTKLR